MRNQKQMKQNLKITSISANSLFVRCVQMTLGWKQQPCSFARNMAVPHAEHCKVSSTIRVKEISGSAWDQRPILNKGGKFKCHITPTWSFQSRKCIDLWNTLWKLMIHQLKLFWTEQNHKQAPLCHVCICFSVFSRGIMWKSKATVTLGETVVGDCSDHVKSTCQDSNKKVIRVRLLSVLGIKLAATCIRLMEQPSCAHEHRLTEYLGLCSLRLLIGWRLIANLETDCSQFSWTETSCFIRGGQSWLKVV